MTRYGWWDDGSGNQQHSTAIHYTEMLYSTGLLLCTTMMHLMMCTLMMAHIWWWSLDADHGMVTDNMHTSILRYRECVGCVRHWMIGILLLGVTNAVLGLVGNCDDGIYAIIVLSWPIHQPPDSSHNSVIHSITIRFVSARAYIYTMCSPDGNTGFGVCLGRGGGSGWLPIPHYRHPPQIWTP